MSPTDTQNLEPIYVSVKQAAEMLSVKPWLIYQLLRDPANGLDARYLNSRRVITLASVRAFAADLPTERPEAS